LSIHPPFSIIQSDNPWDRTIGGYFITPMYE
jgi:hypothetical protein